MLMKKTPQKKAASPRNDLPSQIRRARVLVAGDVMLDRYWFGEVSRI